MKKLYLHPLPVRIWHWVNVISFLVLIITGLQIRYGDIASLTKFRTAVDIHNIFGLILVLDFCFWLVYYLLTRKIKIYIPPFNVIKFLRGCLIQARYYGFGLFVGESNPHHPSPENKFNPLQQSAYFMIMLLLFPLQIISGILLWDIRMFAVVIDILGGLNMVDLIHVMISFFFTSFLFIHVYLTTLGTTPLEHIKAMFTGYEEIEEH